MPDDEWLEHQSSSGRKFYENVTTREIQWKPPRKKNTNRYSYSAENNIGIVLQKGDLRIATGKKKKYTQSVGYLTNTHFLYTKKHKPDDHFLKISLLDADIKRDGHAFVLQNTFHTIRFKSKTTAEIWYHDILNVIHNLSKDKDNFNQNFQPATRQNKAFSLNLETIYEELKYPTPPGWIANFDPFTQKYVYISDRNYWEKWSVQKLNDGRVYFKNAETGEKSWLLPWKGKETTV